MNFDKNYIQELKNENYEAPMILDSENIRIKILHRGEYLFFLEKRSNRALIIEIDVINSIVYAKSIKKWDNGKLVSVSEVETIISHIRHYFENYQKKIVKVVS